MTSKMDQKNLKFYSPKIDINKNQYKTLDSNNQSLKDIMNSDFTKSQIKNSIKIIHTDSSLFTYETQKLIPKAPKEKLHSKNTRKQDRFGIPKSIKLKGDISLIKNSNKKVRNLSHSPKIEDKIILSDKYHKRRQLSMKENILEYQSIKNINSDIENQLNGVKSYKLSEKKHKYRNYNESIIKRGEESSEFSSNHSRNYVSYMNKMNNTFEIEAADYNTSIKDLPKVTDNTNYQLLINSQLRVNPISIKNESNTNIVNFNHSNLNINLAEERSQCSKFSSAKQIKQENDLYNSKIGLDLIYNIFFNKIIENQKRIKMNNAGSVIIILLDCIEACIIYNSKFKKILDLIKIFFDPNHINFDNKLKNKTDQESNSESFDNMKNSAIEKELNALTNKIKEKEKDLKLREERINERENFLLNKQKRLLNQESKLELMEREFLNRESNLESQQQYLSTKQKEYEEFIIERNLFEEQTKIIAEKESDLFEREKEINLKENNFQKVNEITLEIELLKEELNQLKETNALMKEENNQFKVLLEDKDKEIKNLKSNNELKNDLSNLKIKYKHLKKKYLEDKDELEKYNSDLFSKIKDKEIENKFLREKENKLLQILFNIHRRGVDISELMDSSELGNLKNINSRLNLDHSPDNIDENLILLQNSNRFITDFSDETFYFEDRFNFKKQEKNSNAIPLLDFGKLVDYEFNEDEDENKANKSEKGYDKDNNNHSVGKYGKNGKYGKLKLNVKEITDLKSNTISKCKEIISNGSILVQNESRDAIKNIYTGSTYNNEKNLQGKYENEFLEMYDEFSESWRAAIDRIKLN